MYLLASQIFCNIATDTGIPGMCLCYQQFKHPAETAVGWRKMSFCDSKLVFWLLAWGWKSWVWRMNTQSKRKRGQGGRNKGTPNNGLVKRRGDGPRCNACRKKRHLATWSSLCMCILCKLTCGSWNGWGAFSTKNSAFRINFIRRKTTSTRKTYLWRRPHQRRETK